MSDLLVLTKARIALVVAFVAAVVALVDIFGIVDYTEEQSLTIGAFATAVLILIMAITQHFRKGTPQEPVAIGTSFSGAVSSGIALAVAFAWVHWSDQQIAAVMATVLVFLALVGGWVVREAVTAKPTPDA